MGAGGGGGWGPCSLHGPQDGAGRPEQECLQHGHRGVQHPASSPGWGVRTSGSLSLQEAQLHQTALQQRHSMSQAQAGGRGPLPSFPGVIHWLPGLAPGCNLLRPEPICCNRI